MRAAYKIEKVRIKNNGIKGRIDRQVLIKRKSVTSILISEKNPQKVEMMSRKLILLIPVVLIRIPI